MKMTKFEKKFVNSKNHAEKNIKLMEQLFSQIDTSNVKNVLEIGCGTGTVAAYLAEKYMWKITGTDLDPEQISKAKQDNKENEYLNFFEADATGLPFGNNEFDLVLSFYVMHHIPAWNNVFAEIGRFLKPEGYYLIYDLALPIFTARTFKHILNKHMGVYAMKDIINSLGKNKFEIIYKKIPKMIMLMSHFSIISKKIR